METKKANIIVSLSNISNTLVQISLNTNKNMYESQSEELQETLQKIYNKLQKYI